MSLHEPLNSSFEKKISTFIILQDPDKKKKLNLEIYTINH